MPTIRIRLPAAMACGFALALGGCAPGGGFNRIAYVDQMPLYTPSLVNYASQSGEFAVEIRGDPFPRPTDAEAIATVLRLPGYLSPARLTTRPGPKVARNIRVVLVFNPAWAGPGGNDPCRDLASQPIRSGGPIATVDANLCVDGRTVAWLVADGEAGNGPTDPRFVHLMNEVMQNLLPPQGPIERDQDHDRFPL